MVVVLKDEGDEEIVTNCHELKIPSKKDGLQKSLSQKTNLIYAVYFIYVKYTITQFLTNKLDILKIIHY